MRDREVSDSELRLLGSVQRTVQEQSGQVPLTRSQTSGRQPEQRWAA
jgi:hypothetical protein